MNGELAQLIAVAAHGSAWLAGRTGEEPPDLEGGNSTFEYVHSVRFELPGRLLRAPTVSSSVADWLLAARQRGAGRLWLATPSGQPQAIVASSTKGPIESWTSTWVVGDEDAPEHRIWDVTYRGQRDPKVVLSTSNVVEATDELATALRRTAAFARDHDLDEWAAVFEAALGMEHAPDPQPPYHPDMFPSTAFGRPSRRLLAMATRAFVFGGMGSWNDLAFEGADAKGYIAISGALYAAVLSAFGAAVNGSLDR